ncbi:Hypothetical protein I5071_68610 [Sandaracinus amylolyticus]|nr:Hypothetical protein I5071_68610 [Sandaracinus amylolyticus]
MPRRSFTAVTASLLLVATACASDPGTLDVDAGPGYRRDGSPGPSFRPSCAGDGGQSGDASCGDGEVPMPEEDAGPPPPPCNEITFTLDRPGATSVWLSGSFLADASGTWPSTPEAGALELVNDGSGHWSVTHLVEPVGRHLYKFIVDETTWIFDPANDVREPDPFGSFNSVVSVCDVVPTGPVEGRVGDLEYRVETSADGYDVVITYVGTQTLDLAGSTIRLNGADVELPYDAETKTFTISRSDLAPNKYSYLLRLRTTTGANLTPLFLPIWIGEDYRYAGFSWTDGIVYQIFTDRFANGDPGNDIDNSAGTLAQVTDRRSQWQGGDFAGITQRIEDGYFDDMGINALWISSPILNSHGSQPAVDPADTRKFSSYHSYHPIATGHTHLDDYGYPNPIEPAFGTPEELHELVNAAHARGIRVIPDFVANHVQFEANIYERHPEWFFDYEMCHDNWDRLRVECWFTSLMPDVDYGGNPAAVDAVVAHAIWMVQEFDFDGFRADALKHMDDVFTRELRAAIVEQVETTVHDHARPFEPASFYMVGESLGGWARYHVREDMVQGQVDEGYYNRAKASLLTFGDNLQSLAGFAIGNDSAYRSPQPTMGGVGGYPGAVMGNFFGNHDQWRALTEAGGATAQGYARLRLAQTFLFTSPYNVPMLYQGDDIGTLGGQDPDNRAFMRFTGLSAEEQRSLQNAQRAGRARAEHQALRRGRRETVLVDANFWAYRVTHPGAEDVYVVLNRGDARSWSPPASGYVDALGNCTGGSVPALSSCIYVPSP